MKDPSESILSVKWSGQSSNQESRHIESKTCFKSQAGHVDDKNQSHSRWFHPIVQAKISQPQATYYPWYTSWIQKNIDDIITQNHNFHRPHMSSYIQTNPKHVNISTSCHQCNWTSSGNKTKTHTFLPSGFMDIYGCSIPSIWGFPKMGVPLNHSCWFPL
jgi:hypothetical protein